MDDEGQVVRWQDWKPCHGQYVEVRPKRKPKPKIDWDNIEEALF